jgi:hypothetical protein
LDALPAIFKLGNELFLTILGRADGAISEFCFIFNYLLFI